MMNLGCYEGVTDMENKNLTFFFTFFLTFALKRFSEKNSQIRLTIECVKGLQVVITRNMWSVFMTIVQY